MSRAIQQQARWSVGVLFVFLILTIGCGCGAAANGEGTVGSPRVLSSGEAKRLLLRLPYRYRWRQVPLPKGASGALAGTAMGKHRTVIHFGVAFGTAAEAVPVPQAGRRNPYDYSQGGGFVFTDDIIVPRSIVPSGIGKQIKTAAQWHEANIMEVEMEEKLCKASTGEPCPA